jgi:hypothetical protein
MKGTFLIDAVVRQSMVLIATLATASGHRASLANLANQIFADLVEELREQGLGNRVIADMFGMALRTYQAKMARLAGSETDSGRFLWEAVLTHVTDVGPVLRSGVLERFARDDERDIRGVLRDLVDSGLLVQDGRGAAASYRVAEPDAAISGDEALRAFCRVLVFRHGPLDRERLLELAAPSDSASVSVALEALIAEGTVTVTRTGPRETYSAIGCVIPFGDAAGWQASVLDHHHAVVSALVTKLRTRPASATLDDRVGGSTFTFDLWQGHPLEGEVVGFLKEMRARGMELRRRLEAHNRGNPRPEASSSLRVVSYVGQTVLGEGTDDESL